MEKINLPSVGEILKEEFMKPYHLSAYSLSRAIGVPTSRIQDILHNRRAVTMDTSIRLGLYFDISTMYFINIQNDIDSRKIFSKDKESLALIIPISSKKSA